MVKQPFSSKCKGSSELQLTTLLHREQFRYEEHDTTGNKGMLYLTRTLDLEVKVNSREGMEVEKLEEETAIKVIQRVYVFKSTKKA